MLAPIALFVYKRPQHARQVLDSLATNPEFAQSPLFVFSDGPRRADETDAINATRAVIRANAPSGTTIVERPSNVGLAESIISGVTQLCERYGRVIVIEDDLAVSPHFLEYMNAALRRYADEDRVMQISGFMFSVDLDLDDDCLFVPFTTSWGWATWERAWRHFDARMQKFDCLVKDKPMRQRFNLGGAYNYYEILRRQRKQKVDSWATRWYLSVFMRNGLTLYPKRSLVENHGMIGGTHCAYDPFRTVMNHDFHVRRFPNTITAASCWPQIAAHIRERNALLPVLMTRIMNLFRARKT